MPKQSRKGILPFSSIRNLEQMPLSHSQQLTVPCKWLIDEIKQNSLRENDWRTDNLTNNRQLFNCDNRRIETHQLLITSLHKPTSQLNWQITNNTATHPTWYDSLWLWRWLLHRLSKRQSLSTTTVLFRTTFTRTIKLNLLLKWLLGSDLSQQLFWYIYVKWSQQN